MYCIFLQETHSNESDEKFWSNQWGDKILFSHGTSRSAGVGILFNNCPGKVATTKSSDEGHWLLCVLHTDDSSVFLGNMYGYCNTVQNRNLLEEVTDCVYAFMTL